MATSSDCEKKKLASSVKKPRKKITIASRRARSSSVLSTSSMMISVTPASRPTMVLCETMVSTSAISSRPPLIQRLGSGRWVHASQARHSSSA